MRPAVVVRAAHRVEACVIGAGVVGLAVARALAIQGKEVLILEREGTFGSGISSRNSEVIHAGIYYNPGSLKAKLCRGGRDMLYNYCNQRSIPHERKGKLIVATTESQVQNNIPQILNQAQSNGVNDLVKLSKEDAYELEPEVTCSGAIFSPSTGVVDSHSFMISLLADAENHGATIAFNSKVVGASVVGKEHNNDKNNLVVDAEGISIACSILVNSAGLHANQISNMILNNRGNNNKNLNEINRNPVETAYQDEMQQTIKSPQHHEYFAKGNYFRLEGQQNPFHHLVYPMPGNGGLGVHATIDLGGSVRFGPDVEWIDPDVHDPDSINLDVTADRAQHFYAEVRKYWPHLKDNALQPDYAGIRPKLGHPLLPNSPSIKSDFVIEDSDSHGIPGFVNLLGIESPGLTASMAIGAEVAKRLQKL